MAKRWYVKQGSEVSGPLSSSQLRHAVEIGHLTPSTQVSFDRERWYSAAKIKGLEFSQHLPTRKIVPPPPMTPPRRPPPPPPVPEKPSPPSDASVSSAGRKSDEKPSLSELTLLGLLVGGALVVVVAFVFSSITANANSDLEQALQACSSRDGVDVTVYYDNALVKTDVIFDFQEATGSVRRIDPVHLLLQFGQKLELASTQRLILARNGRHLFYIPSSDLQELTNEYTFGNPIWSFNHLPERLRRMDGQRAYGQWQGGWLGVLEKQTTDLSAFISDWIGF